MKGYREKLFQNEWLSTGMSCAESCAVSAIKKISNLSWESPWATCPNFEDGFAWIRRMNQAEQMSRRLDNAKVPFTQIIPWLCHISYLGFFLSFIVPLEIELCMYSKEKLLQKENKTVIKWQLNGSFHFF